MPVNFAWKFNINDKFSVTPYLGLNFRVNMSSRMKYVSEYETNMPSDMLPKDFKKKDESDWYNCLSSSEKHGMGSKEETWNVFQMGWQIGVGARYSNYYLGLQYGTDFIPSYKHTYKDEDEKTSETYKINNGTFKVKLGYYF